eukprot:GHVU01102867.1.p1 GENE.GHVU01102867.1~~GHVU01102867.1.p1  ORF type:complete len:144 (+),score=0.64 GHVU01102867.1:316-747(+)
MSLPGHSSGLAWSSCRFSQSMLCMRAIMPPWIPMFLLRFYGGTLPDSLTHLLIHRLAPPSLTPLLSNSGLTACELGFHVFALVEASKRYLGEAKVDANGTLETNSAAEAVSSPISKLLSASRAEPFHVPGRFTRRSTSRRCLS